MLAEPESTYCSAQTTRPLPTQSRSTPASARSAHSRRPAGSFSPRSRANAASSTPAIRKRTAARRNGGSATTPTRMARWVEPQTKQTISQAASERPRSSPTRNLRCLGREHADLLEHGGEHDGRLGGRGLALGAERAQHALEPLDGGHRDLEDVAVFPGHMMALEDVGVLPELENPRLGADVVRCRIPHRDERGDGPADSAAIEQRRVPADDAQLLQPLDPLHDRGAGEADLVGKALVGRPAVLDQVAQEGQAGGVEGGGWRGNRGHGVRRKEDRTKIFRTNRLSSRQISYFS